MNNLEYMPIAEAGLSEEVQEQSLLGSVTAVQQLPRPVNYADDDATVAYVKDQLIPLMIDTRMERQTIETEWTAIRNMNMLKHDGGQSYRGRSNAYLPVYRKARGTHISSLSSGLFPSDDYMDVTAWQDQGSDNAKALKLYLQWEFDVNAKLRGKMKPFLGQYIDYGTSIFKVMYRKQLQPVIQPKMVMGKPSYGMNAQNYCEGLQVSPRNLFNWYVYPTTAESLDDASLVFEDIDLPRAYFEMMQALKKWKDIERVFSNIEVTAEQHAQALIDARGGNGRPGRTFGKTEAGDIGTVTEAYCFMKLPKDAYLPGENTDLPLPTRLVVANDVVLEVTRNPFYHQRTPYLEARSDVEPGYFYGTGVGRTFRYMQYLASDFANQTVDVGTYGLNPIAKMNPGLMVGPPRPLKPGGTLYMSDVVNGLQFDRPPIEGVGFGMNMLSTIIGMSNDFGGTPPALQGSNSGGGGKAKTATGMQILQRNASMPIQDAVGDIEQSVMCNMMYYAHCLGQQFRDNDVEIAVAGQSLKVPREVLALNAQYRWLASSQAVNNQQRAQQAIQLIQAIMPMLPVLMQSGYVVDFVPLIKKVYVDGFGFRGFQEFIRPAQAAPQVGPMGPQGPTGAPPTPDQMGGVQQEQGDRIRSAMEQIYGSGNADMTPGEGEDFMQVRDNADDMAAQQGGGIPG